VHEQASHPGGRLRAVVPMSPWKIWVEVASCTIRREEFDREILQDVQGKDQEVLQQNTVEGGLAEEHESLPTALHALVQLSEEA
jgi:hypothetical protein